MDLYLRVRSDGMLYHHVVKQIEELILSGFLRPGDKLPSERVLAENFEVSRTVIREAVKTLQQRGWVETRQGKGIYIVQLKPQIVTDSMDRILSKYNTTMEHLVDAREMLETSVIVLAVQLINEDQLEQMAQSIINMDNSLVKKEEFIFHDHQFHMTLAEAAANPVYLIFMNSILGLTQMKRIHMILHSPYSMKRAQEHHRLIYDALMRRDEDEALAALQGHFKQIREDIEEFKEFEFASSGKEVDTKNGVKDRWDLY